jgi:hypothetical protein
MQLLAHSQSLVATEGFRRWRRRHGVDTCVTPLGWASVIAIKRAHPIGGASSAE